MIFNYDYKAVIEDFGKDGKLLLGAAMKILENAGNAHSDSCGNQVFTISKDGKAWVLMEWQIEVLDYPKYDEAIKVETWIENVTSPLMCSRNLLMYKNGEPCIKAVTKWVMLDINTGRPCKLEASLVEKYSPEDKTVFENSKLAKILVPENFESEKIIDVQRRDIDFNDHVHNLVYIDYALETLPYDIYKNNGFKKIRVTYKTSLKENSKAVCRYGKVGEGNVVQICNEENQICCLVELK